MNSWCRLLNGQYTSKPRAGSLLIGWSLGHICPHDPTSRGCCRLQGPQQDTPLQGRLACLGLGLVGCGLCLNFLTYVWGLLFALWRRSHVKWGTVRMWVGCYRRRRLRHMTRVRLVSPESRETQTPSKYPFVWSCQLLVMLMWHFSTWWIDCWRSLFLIVSFYSETVLHMPTSSRHEQQSLSLFDLHSPCAVLPPGRIQSSSHVGPKSDMGPCPAMGRGPLRWFLWLFLWWWIVVGAQGARVVGSSVDPAGASSLAVTGSEMVAKPDGKHVTKSVAQKRAYRRACLRATRAGPNGATWYRGKWMTARALQAQKIPSAGVSLSCQMSRRPSKVPQLQLPRWPPQKGDECLHEAIPPRRAGSVNILSVNLGGITLELYDEFCRWLETETTIANIDIICVQETWRLTSDYVLPHWSWLSSGAEPVSGQGVAVLVNTAYADTAVLRTREIRVGRILQVQMPVKDDKQGRLLNVVCVYVPSKVSESQYVYEKRAAVWTALDKFLTSVLARHFLCVAGDFNTDLQQDAPFVGCTFQWKGHSRAPARDQSTFQNLLRAHSLHAMNTWKHEATYLDHQGSRSRVDYILTRSNTAKGHKSETMPQLHFASWREGSRHLALIGRIDLTSWRNLRSREVSNFQYDKFALVRACQPRHVGFR